MPIYCIGLSHHTAPVELRERFALGDDHLPEALAALRAAGVADEAVILSTCNRVEIYAASAAPSAAALRQHLLASRGAEHLAGSREVYALDEPHSVEHLFKVASGLDSMVLGETEILGQLKKAYDLALQLRHTGRRLNKAFQRAFQVAKQVRTETSIQRGSTSVAAVAVELAEKIFDSLDHREVMVLGAGETSEKAARALLSRGARSVLVSNRSFARAEALALELGGRALHFDDWTAEFPRVDIVISSTSAPHYVLDTARLEPLMALRHRRSLLLIDIAVPRDIDPAVNHLNNVFLYNIDDLQAIADDHLTQRRREIALCEQIIREKAGALLAGGPREPDRSGNAGLDLSGGDPAQA